MTTIEDQIEILVTWQALELEVGVTERQIAARMEEITVLDQAAAERESLVSAEKEALSALKKAYRELEAESKINLAMIAKSNEKLRSVKTNKEYQSILKEIEETEKKNSDIEDRMLEQLELIESQEGAITTKAAQLTSFVGNCQEKKQAAEEEIQQARQTVAALKEKVEQTRAEAAPQTIATLDRVRETVRGMAVVPAQGETCMGCHMNIPAQLFNELRRYDEIRFCPHCRRIIYWKEKENA
ncbi:conserved hypothetical protein [Desulfosarcina cetonica]|uniref:zinc ribbon domain-containing protein n=1 Tax=Desulfosarcina cetonica TaxID=90730 RepID=UPI0006D1CB63|nr:C4-type zinc ribbon domain-containing protein [Desulfosarcina cetonica]VTR65144.1 conserved hypothetical protein [Desulfosarcina cetonica]